MNPSERSVERLTAIVESLSEAILLIDAEERVQLANASAQALLGLAKGAVGARLSEITEEQTLLALAAAGRRGERRIEEFELSGRGRRKVQVRAVPHRAGDAILILRDVTELRRFEKVRRDFVANVSHELRTPMSIILANAETLLGGALEEPTQARTFLAAIHRHAERLSRLVSDLLDLSRLEAGHFTLHLEDLSLEEVARRVASGLEPKAASLSVGLSVAPGDHPVRADSRALEQILINLMDNAVKYSVAGGHVDVRCSDAGPLVRVEVEDDGPGIEHKHRPRLFERFYRVDKGRSREVGGTGLGLAIVKHLVEALGGEVGMTSAEPHGSVFWFTIPARNGSEPAEFDDQIETLDP